MDMFYIIGYAIAGVALLLSMFMLFDTDLRIAVPLSVLWFLFAVIPPIYELKAREQSMEGKYE